MGEYAKVKATGEMVKIGTCGDMYYLRFDHRHLVDGHPGSVDPSRAYIGLRFRFPFPWEDDKGPGEFEPFKEFGLSLDAPEEIEHNKEQFVSSRGMNVCLPCPYSKEGKASTYKVHYNGYAGGVRIVQQKPLADGRLALVCACGGCGAKWRIEDPAELAPIIGDLLRRADYKDNEGRRSRQYWAAQGKPINEHDGGDGWAEREIARRILAGYGVIVGAEEWLKHNKQSA